MPELPEVETVARGLRASLVGRTITGVEVSWARTLVPPDPVAFARRLVGQVISGVGRRGKWILIALDDGDTLLVHLRMTGQLVLEPVDSPDDRHVRVLFSLDDGWWLRFSDQRKFGRMEEMLARRRGRIKPLLLNQRFVAGLGNIYADESLWRAGVHPLRQAGGLGSVEVRRLHRGIRSVLQAAIDSGGTTLADSAYRQPDGRSGEFYDLLAVYGREGQPCVRCGATIERIVVGQRGTHYCPCCQPPAPSRSPVR